MDNSLKMKYLIPLVLSIVAYSQETVGFQPSYNATPNVLPTGLIVANVFSEYFDTTTPTGQWASNSGSDAYVANESALVWTAASGTQTKPGFNFYALGHGGASAPWPVGSGAFDFKFDAAWGTAGGSQVGIETWTFGQGFMGAYGAWAGVSTDPAGSQTVNTITLLCAVAQDGPLCSVRQGIPFLYSGSLSLSGATATSYRGDAASDNFVTGMNGQSIWLTDQFGAQHGPYAVSAVNTGTNTMTLTPTPSGSWVVGGRYYSWSADLELTTFNSPNTGITAAGSSARVNPYSIWPVGDLLAVNPTYTFEITRDGTGDIVFNVFSPVRQGTSPWLSWTCNVATNCNIPAGLQAFSLGYVDVENLNFDHTGWTGGLTTTSQGPARGYPGWIGNMRGNGVIIAGIAPTVTSVYPTASGGTLTSGTAVTITGSNFNSGSTIHVGLGTTAVSASTSFVSSTTLTATLPTQSNNGCIYGASATHTLQMAQDATPCAYEFKVIDPSGIEARLSGGLNYEAAVVNRIDPQEAVIGDTLTVTGSGFASNVGMTISGQACGSVTYINPTQFTCVAPSGVSAGALPHIVVSNGGSSIFDSTTAGTAFNGTGPTQLIFGYSKHPQFLDWMTGGAGTTAASLSAMKTAYNAAITAGSGLTWDYAQIGENQITVGPTTTANYSPQGWWTLGNPTITSFGATYHYPVSTQTFQDWGYHYLEAGDSTSLTNFGTYLPYHTTQIAFLDQLGNRFYFQVNNISAVGELYDLLFASLTLAQREAMTQYVIYGNAFCTYSATQSNAFFKGSSTPTSFGGSNNLVADSNGPCGIANLTMYNSDPQAAARLSTNDTRLSNYLVSSYYSDGVPLEGSQYMGLALSNLLPYAEIRKAVTGSDGGLLSNTHLLNFQSFVPSMFGAGGWTSNGVSGACSDLTTFIYSDNEPEHQSPLVLTILGALGTPNSQLNAYADCQQHVISASSLYGANTYLDGSGQSAGGFWPFAFRYNQGFSNTYTITGYPTYFSAQQSGCPSGCTTTTTSNYVGMKSDASATPPDAEVLVTGKNVYGNHNHADEGSFRARFSGEEFIFDPGYNDGTTGADDSYLSINGTLPAVANATGILDATTSNCTRHNSNYQVGCWVMTTAFAGVGSGAVNPARRTVILYSTQTGGTGAYHARALVLLDDITSSTAYNVVNRYESVKSSFTSYCPSGTGGFGTCTTNTGAGGKAGYTVPGTNTNLNIEFYNVTGLTPTLTSSTFPVSAANAKYYFCNGSTATPSSANCLSNGIIGAGGSWIYNNIIGPYSAYWQQLTAQWSTGTATNVAPLVTVLMPSAGGLSVSSYANSGTQIVITFSDSSNITFNLTGGIWILQ